MDQIAPLFCAASLHIRLVGSEGPEEFLQDAMVAAAQTQDRLEARSKVVICGDSSFIIQPH